MLVGFTLHDSCCSAPVKRPPHASLGLDCKLILHMYLFWGAWKFVQLRMLNARWAFQRPEVQHELRPLLGITLKEQGWLLQTNISEQGRTRIRNGISSHDSFGTK